LIKKGWIDETQDLTVRNSVFPRGEELRSMIRKYHKAKLRLVISAVVVVLLFNKSPISFFDFEVEAFKPPVPEGSQYSSGLQLVSNNSSDNVSALVDQGNVLLSEGKYAQAIQRYDEVLTIDELDYAILNSAVLGAGYAHIGLGNYTEAIPYFDKALE
jgi:tetratricopeptide (TPR) repeat protein